MTVKFAILGAGRIGQVHAKAIQATDGAELIAIAEPIEVAANAAKAKFGCDLRDIDQIASSQDVDAVVICTPTDTHADLIEQFCRVGKAVFCEKPIDLDIKRVKECLKVVEDTNGMLMVGFNRRFDPDFMALKKTIDDGRIGDVEMITITSRDPAAPPYEYITRSGGIYRDMTIHDFDVARWLIGEEIVTVQAAVEPDHQHAVCVFAIEANRASSSLLNACNLANERRFPSTVVTHDSDVLTFTKLKIGSFKGMYTTVVFGQVRSF